MGGRGGINRAGYGGAENIGTWYGASWHHSTTDTIQVTRLPDDVMADQVHVRVWVIDPPDYDSGWIIKSLGNTHIDHNLGMSNTDLMAAVRFSGTAKGIHHCDILSPLKRRSFSSYARRNRPRYRLNGLSDRTIKYYTGCIPILVYFKSTTATMYTKAQIFCNYRTTSAALLTGVAWVYFYQFATSFSTLYEAIGRTHPVPRHVRKGKGDCRKA